MGAILDLGREMMITGAEVWRVEDLMERLFDAYCFKSWDVWVISSCVTATVRTWNDREYTEIRRVKDRSYDLDKLERLYELAEETIETPTSVDTIRAKVDEILERPGLPTIQVYIAAAMAGVGFSFFYSGGFTDALIVVIMSMAFTAFSRRMGSLMDTRLAFNAAAAFIMETIALILMAGGIGSDIAAVTTAGILLLASGIGFASGIGDFLHGDTLTGLGETSSSLMGAAGIAIGIYISMIFFRDFLKHHVVLEGAANLIADPVTQLISCTIGCAGFALMFGARRRALIFSVIGSCFTWVVYLIAVHQMHYKFFLATMISACFIALYAGVVNAATRIPAPIFLTSCAFPLLPGSNLYYTVFGLVSRDMELFRSQGIKMLLVSIGIALGFIIVSNFIQIVRSIYFRIN